MAFWSPAIEKREFWRLVVGVLILAVFIFGGPLIGILAGHALTGLDAYEIIDGTSPLAMTVMFSTFLFYYIGLGLVLTLLHKRGIRSLFGPSRALNMRHYVSGVLIAGGLALFLLLFQFVEKLFLPAGMDVPVVLNLDTGTWAIWLIPALLLIAMQSLAEELVFRGYILQQLRARFNILVVWAVLPSLLFGVLHFDPGTFGVVNGAMYVISTTVSGTVAALVTIRTGNLGAAAGLHFGNNASMVFIGNAGHLDGFSLFVAEMGPTSSYTTYSMALQTGLIMAVYFIWWRWMNRREAIA